MKLVLTGGPSGGKTTVAMALQKEFSRKVVVVPEAASILYGGGFPRRPGVENVQHRQKAIYCVQRELEELTAHETSHLLLVCDRGSLDGAAYWPLSQDDFLSAVGSSLEAEIARYDWVLHLDTAPVAFYDLGNPLRTENFSEAWRLNEKVKEAWSQHPKRIVIANDGHFVDKLHRALFVIEKILAGASFEQITKNLGTS
jgi:nicotinamide riboside kinase